MCVCVCVCPCWGERESTINVANNQYTSNIYDNLTPTPIPPRTQEQQIPNKSVCHTQQTAHWARVGEGSVTASSKLVRLTNGQWVSPLCVTAPGSPVRTSGASPRGQRQPPRESDHHADRIHHINSGLRNVCLPHPRERLYSRTGQVLVGSVYLMLFRALGGGGRLMINRLARACTHTQTHTHTHSLLSLIHI